MHNTVVVNTYAYKPVPANAKRSLLTLEDLVAIGYALYDAGFEPAWSTDFTGDLVAGYGEAYSGFKYDLLPVDLQRVRSGIIPWEVVKRNLECPMLRIHNPYKEQTE